MNIKENQITINGNVSIGATVSCPDDTRKYPAIVLIMGTGKTDRDGNEKNFKTDIYKNLAKMFTELGLVSVRYDKRGTYQTEGDYNTAGLNELIEDSVSVIRYTKTLPYVDETKVIVCGHSEGAMIATLLSTKEDTAGLLLLGGAATCMKDALLYQNRLAAEEFSKKKGVLGMLLRSQTSMDKSKAKLDAMFQKCVSAKKARVFFGGTMLNAKWLREHASYTSEDFVKILSGYPGKVLAITGTADLSADYHDLDKLHGMAHITCYAPQNVNHILRKIDDDNSMMTVAKQYKRLSAQPIVPEVTDTISAWLAEIAQGKSIAVLV